MDAPGTAHVSFGFASLILGAGIFALGKGTDLHRCVGMLYALSMFGLNLTALLIYRMFGRFGVFHVLALSSLTLIMAGLFTVLLKRPRNRWLRNHYYLMGWSYVGLWAAFATEIMVRVVRWPLVMAVTVPTVFVVVLGGVLVRILEQQTMRSMRQLEHRPN
jgi:uncharacterized membrane protein